MGSTKKPTAEKPAEKEVDMTEETRLETPALPMEESPAEVSTEAPEDEPTAEKPAEMSKEEKYIANCKLLAQLRYLLSQGETKVNITGKGKGIPIETAIKELSEELRGGK